MRIAIDCRAISDVRSGEMTGPGQYAWHLVRHLLRQDDENAYVLFFNDRTPRETMAELVGGHRHAFARTLPRLFGIAQAITKERPDVYHGASGSLPPGFRGRSVVTVHDLAAVLHPEWYSGGRLFARRDVNAASVERADRVIAVSHATRRDLMRAFPVPEEKIRVVYQGVEHRTEPLEDEHHVRTLRRLGLDRHPYFLYLGRIEPRKNVDGLVRAYESLAERFPSLTGETGLVVAGAAGWKSERVMSDIAAVNRKLGRARIKAVGYVAPEDKTAVMAHALAFVFPTRHEGFGLPVLEAMSLGVPVISSNVSAIPEIVGRAGILVDPDHKAELVLAMKLLLENPVRRAELAKRGHAHAQEFRWEKCAGETLEVYHETVRAAA